MNKKLLSLFLSSVIVVSAFAGCNQQSTDKGNSSSAKSQSSSKPTENAQLRFSWWGNDERHQVTLKVIEMYTAKNPNVKIEAEYRGKSEREKIAVGLAGGNIADIVQLNPPWMGDFTATGDFFVDLNTKKDLINLSGFDQKLLNDYGVYNGKLIALPTGVNARTTIINKTQAAKYGIPTSIDTKWTWDDLYENGKKVNQKDSTKYFLNADTVDMTEFVLRPYIIQKTGKQLIGDDYTLGFSKEDLTEALNYISKLYKDKVVIPASEGNVFLNSVWTNPKWINGDLVTEFSWTSLIGSATADIKDDTDIFILPIRKDAKDTSLVVKPSQLLSVSNKSQYIDAAVRFMDFFFNDIEAGKVLKDNRSLPPVATVQKACLDAGLINKKVIDGTKYGQEHAGLYENTLSTNAEIVKVLNDAIEKVAYGNPVDATVDQSMKLIQDILATMKK